MSIFKIRGSPLTKTTGLEILEKHQIPRVPIVGVVSISYRYMNLSEKEIIAEITYNSGDIVQYVYYIDFNDGWRFSKRSEIIK